MKILIADDDPTILKLLEHILLTVKGYEIKKASDGQECWELLESGYRPDVCLLDIEMPLLSGLDLLERMRSDSEYDSIPVLIVTSRTDIESKASAAALRSYAFIVKPFDPKRVLSLVAEASVSAGKSFEPDGFVPKNEVIKRHGMNASQYFRQIVYFVGMLNQRIESLDAMVSKGDWREIKTSLAPLNKLANFIGATPFEDLFHKIEESALQDAVDALECAKRHYMRLRFDFDQLRTLLEARLNVIIPSGSARKIETLPSPVDGSEADGVCLQASIFEEESASASGAPGVKQSVVLTAKRGESDIMTAKLEYDNSNLVLRSTIEAPIGEAKKSFDIALYPEKPLEQAIRVTAPKKTRGRSAS